MKKQKKQRKPMKAFSGDVDLEPLEIVILDEPEGIQMLFSLSNRGVKMLKAGRTMERAFLKDGRKCVMAIMHRDVYNQEYKEVVELRKKQIVEKAKQAVITESSKSEVE